MPADWDLEHWVIMAIVHTASYISNHPDNEALAAGWVPEEAVREIIESLNACIEKVEGGE